MLVYSYENKNTKREGALFVGRLSEEKGIKILLKAWENLSIKLKIIGDGPLSSLVMNNNNPNIEYLGFIKNVNEEISKSLLMIAPIYIGAGLKMKIPHIMSCGVPVITTSVGAEGIDINKENGLIVNDNIDSIIELSIEYLKNHENLIKLGLKAKQSVIKLFSSNNIIKKLNKIYISN